GAPNRAIVAELSAGEPLWGSPTAAPSSTVAAGFDEAARAYPDYIPGSGGVSVDGKGAFWNLLPRNPRDDRLNVLVVDGEVIELDVFPNIDTRRHLDAVVVE